MKKIEQKKIMRMQNNALKHKNGILVKMILIVMLVFTAPTIFSAIADSNKPDIDIVLMGGTTLLASMALIGNIDDVGDQEVAGEQLGYELYLIHINQVNRDNFPRANNNREMGQIPFKEGEKVLVFQAHQIIESESNVEKGDLTTKNTNKVTAIMGGNKVNLLNFIEQYSGDKFIIMYKECDTDVMWMLGTPTRPIILKTSNRKDNKESRSVTLTFESTSIKQPWIYVGSLPVTEPITLIAGSTILSVVSGNKLYLIPNGTDAATPITSVSGLSANDKSSTITLEGLGTDKCATIEDGSVFILEDGATWTARRGSRLTLRVVDSARLVEVPGTRVQTT